MIKAIYLPDLAHSEMPVFILDENDNTFKASGEEFGYPLNVIAEGEDWMVFEERKEYIAISKVDL